MLKTPPMPNLEFLTTHTEIITIEFLSIVTVLTYLVVFAEMSEILTFS